MKIDIIAPANEVRTQNTLRIIRNSLGPVDRTAPESVEISTTTPDLWTPDRLEQRDTFIADLDQPDAELAHHLKQAVHIGRAAIAFIPQRADVADFFANFEIPPREDDRAVLPPTSWYLSPTPGYSVHELVVRKRRGDFIDDVQLKSWITSTFLLRQLQQRSKPN